MNSPRSDSSGANESGSSGFWATFLLSLFLGIFGAHRFYNKTPKSILMLLSLGGFGVWALIDTFTILLGKFPDSKGVRIPNPKPAVSWGIFIVTAMVGLLGNPAEVDGDAGSGSVTQAAEKLSPDSLAKIRQKVVGTYELDQSFENQQHDRILRSVQGYADFNEERYRCFLPSGKVFGWSFKVWKNRKPGRSVGDWDESGGVGSWSLDQRASGEVILTFSFGGSRDLEYLVLKDGEKLIELTAEGKRVKGADSYVRKTKGFFSGDSPVVESREAAARWHGIKIE